MIRKDVTGASLVYDQYTRLDIAGAAEIYAKRQQLGEDAISYAYEIKIEALALWELKETGLRLVNSRE